jgi:hypothetical protein
VRPAPTGFTAVFCWIVTAPDTRICVAASAWIDDDAWTVSELSWYTPPESFSVALFCTVRAP